MFSKPSKQQALALAAIFQASNQVYKLAYTGDSDADKMAFSMSTLLNQNPDSLEQLYGAVENLQDGLATMQKFLENANNISEPKYKEIISYVMSSIHLASKLSADQQLLTKIEHGIDNARQQAEHFTITHDNVYSNVGALYQETISKMRLRIQVMGSAVYLQQSAVSARIRCMLFAAIRNAFLWRQLGGKRRHLLLQRKAFIQIINDL
ncbi:MAG: high frequency lysogenization protein HflD [Porticoccaceae bacterium]|nr:high frequency lysogenization protein HflD [Porticoccaceae bacterium]